MGMVSCPGKMFGLALRSGFLALGFGVLVNPLVGTWKQVSKSIGARNGGVTHQTTVISLEFVGG